MYFISTHTRPTDVCLAIVSVLTTDLLKPKYRFMLDPANPTAGHCYHAAEAAYHLIGGKSAGWKPYVGRDLSGITHWWLKRDNEIVDPTADQYYCIGLQPPYDKGRGCGFMTKAPSTPASTIISRILNENRSRTQRIARAY